MGNGLLRPLLLSSSQSMDKGVYILLVQNDECQIRVGASGKRIFSAGWHAYVGSALGAGGFARVMRHFRLNSEKDRRPCWHIDSLLISPCFQVTGAYCIHTQERIECHIAHQMTGDVITGFGSSDCSCKGHLFYYPYDPTGELLHLIHSLSRQGTIHGVDFRSPYPAGMNGLQGHIICIYKADTNQSSFERGPQDDQSCN